MYRCPKKENGNVMNLFNGLLPEAKDFGVSGLERLYEDTNGIDSEELYLLDNGKVLYGNELQDYFNNEYKKTAGINEVFELLPRQLNIKKQVGSYRIYSNEYINNRIKALIDEDHKLHPIKTEIIELIDNGKIIIGYTSKGMIRHFLRRIKTRLNGSMINGIMGYYTPSTDKIVIMLDNSINLFGGDMIGLTVTLIHEMMHKICNLNASEFINHYHNIIELYYSNFVGNLVYIFSKLGMRITDNEKYPDALYTTFTRNLIEIYQNREMSYDVFLDNVYKQWNILLKNTCNASDKDIDNLTGFIMAFMKKQINNNENFSRIDAYIYKCLKQSYKDIGYNTIQSTYYQEIYMPDEIICLIIEKGNANILNNFYALVKEL